MTTQEKREILANAKREMYEDMLYNIFMDGFIGYNNMTDEEINELYEEIFGKDA